MKDQVAKSTDDVKKQVDEIVENAQAKGKIDPAIVGLWEQAKKSGLTLSADQIALFNQNKGLIPFQ